MLKKKGAFWLIIKGPEVYLKVIAPEKLDSMQREWETQLTAGFAQAI